MRPISPDYWYWIAEIADRVLTPALAEVWITAKARDLVGDTEIRGRLMGPQCQYASTVEVAYAIQPLPRKPDDPTSIVGRVVIPEPSLWVPETPFLYCGPVTVFQGRTRKFEACLEHGLRRVSLGPQGLRLNGQPYELRATERDSLSLAEAAALRERGINTLIVPVRDDAASLWATADRLGFFVVGRIAGDEPPEELLGSLRFHASAFGWLVLPPISTAQRNTLKNGGALIGRETAGEPATDFVLSDGTFTALDGKPFGVVVPT